MQLYIHIISVFLVSLTLIVSANGQLQPIVDVNTIKEKGTFTITCNAKRVKFPDADSEDKVKTIIGLIVYYNSTDVPSVSLAQYFSPDIKKTAEAENRGWSVVASGGNSNNTRENMNLVILARSAKCSDAGLYICSVLYVGEIGYNPINGTQNVTAEAATAVPVLKIEPLNSDDNNLSNFSRLDVGEVVKLTCRVNGPENLVIKWRREKRPASGADTMEDYPYKNEITDSEPTKSGTGVCAVFTYVSTLSFNVTEYDTNRLYSCIVQAGTATLTVDAIITRNLAPATSVPVASAGAGKDDIGVIIGAVVGSVVGLLIIVGVIICIVCCCCRKNRNKAPNTDQPDGYTNTQADPYPQTYPSHPSRPAYENNVDRGSKAYDESGRLDKEANRYRNENENSYRRKDRLQNEQTQNSDHSNHQPKPATRYRNTDNQHSASVQYTSIDSAHALDNSADRLMPSPNKEKPKPAPKPKPSVTKRKEADPKLNYADLDLPPKNEERENTRRKAHVPIEYAEISV